MEERVYRFKRTAENLTSIARGIDPNEKNHHILNHFHRIKNDRCVDG
jgi:hypothetical protein